MRLNTRAGTGPIVAIIVERQDHALAYTDLRASKFRSARADSVHAERIAQSSTG